MGVSITAYRKITRVEPTASLTVDSETTSEIEPDDETLYEMGLRPAYAYTPQADHALEGFPGAVWDRSEAIARVGWYRVEDPYPERLSMSYSGYGGLRREIWAAANPDVEIEAMWKDPQAYADRPYWEMAFFADNEGTLGPVACANLAADFRDHCLTEVFRDAPSHLIRRWAGSDTAYSRLRALFTHAAGTGMVIYS